jgi:hypothetical protein
MYKLRRIPFPIAVLCLVFFSSRAVSQQDGPSDAAEDKIRKSHLLDKALAPHPSYEALIESLVKKRQTEEYQRVLDLLKNQKMSREEAMKNPAFLRGLRDNLKVLRENSATPDSVKKLIDQFLDPETATPLSAKELEELTNLAEKAPAATRRGPEAERKDDDGGRNPIGADQTKQQEDTGPIGRAEMNIPGSDEGPSDSKQDYAERILKWLNGSPAMESAIRDLGRNMGPEDPRWGRLSAGIESMKTRWAKWDEALNLDRIWSKRAVTWLAELLPASLPKLRLPDVAAIPDATGEGDRHDRSQLPRGPGTWMLLVAVAAIVVALLIAWSVAGRGRLSLRSAVPEWRLGPWPVDPREVLSREQLVQAFEYLSLLNLGPRARNWNHRLIAVRLAEEKLLKKENAVAASSASVTAGAESFIVNDPLHGSLVAELASLYEQARYAPPSETLSESALAAARRDLCLLAGMTAA